MATEILCLIDCTEEASKNYSALAENFSGFTNLKGANIDQLAVIAKDISLAFQTASTVKKDELDEEIKKLKEPIDDFRLMIEAAIEACARRRKLVFKYYEQRDLVSSRAQQDYREDDTSDAQFRQGHAQQTKRVEEQYERMIESTKTLETELRLFRQEKESEMRVLLSEFVRLQTAANERLRTQWAQFL